MMETLPDLERKLRAALRAQVLRAREDPVEFVRRVGRQEDGTPIRVEPIQAEWHRVLSEHDRVVIFAPVGHGKALDAETEIPTPDGWKRMCDLQPGDLVFNRYGQPTRVTWTSGTYWSEEVYEIEFAKGAKVIADADHQWVVRQSQSGDAREQVLTTRQIVDTLDTGWEIPRVQEARSYDPIVAVRRVAPRLVCCIAVESPCRTYLATRDYVVTHNSNHVVRWRVLWELGRNPNLRVGIISVSKSGVPTKFVSAMRADIESNRWVHLIFPRLRKQTRGQVMWGANGFIVERDLPLPDPSVQMFGLYGKILGSRLDLIIMDDVCNMENTMTETAREKAWEWISGEVLSRLPRHGGRVWAIGHVWHHEDVLNRLSRIEGYVTKTYSAFVRDEHGAEVPLMPRMWTMDELRRREQELGRLASRMLRNVVPRDEHARIRQAGIDKCLMRGRGLSLVESWNPADSPTFTGVDLSVASGRGDLACIFTITILPDGTRRVLDIRSGKWDGPETLRNIVEVHRKFGSIVMVENNAAQDYMLQFANELTTVPLKKHTTGMNKYDVMFGVESLGVEFDQGKWQIPCDDNGQPSGEVAAWLRECLAYTPSDHTGDRLMASWIARECARKSGYGQGGWSYRQDAEMLSIDTLAR